MYTKLISLTEICLLVSMSFAFSYLIHETYEPFTVVEQSSSSSLLSVLPVLGSLLFGKMFVSALAGADLSQGAYTCQIAKDGALCQEYPASECAEKCAGACMPTSREQTASCKLGTCFDQQSGQCSARTPKYACEQLPGKWFDVLEHNVGQCQRGCCISGGQTAYVTEQTCLQTSKLLGIEKVFRPGVDELTCFGLANTQAEGACIVGQDDEGKNLCTFGTKEQCQQRRGSFFARQLCSQPALNTSCQAQARTDCVTGKDEVYWFDSCGNRENIFSLPKATSWNNGQLLSKQASCTLASGLGNAGTCGNCNALAGSICKQQTGAALGSATCKPVTCTDQFGRLKQNGESWCVYQGSTGVDLGSSARYSPSDSEEITTSITGNIVRICADGSTTSYNPPICPEDNASTTSPAGIAGSIAAATVRASGSTGSIASQSSGRGTDTVGSIHYRNTCSNGEVIEEACDDYRNKICVEGKTTIGSASLTNAACIHNRWQLCIFDYNDPRHPENKDKCSKDPHCFIKQVNVGEFSFSMCAPKYPPGFQMGDDASGTGAESICSIASQKCTKVMVKGIGGWKCKANCQCDSAVFTQQLNDLCVSLGDCGMKANYLGSVSESYSVSGAPRLSGAYRADITKYADERLFKNKVAEPGSLADTIALLGIPPGLGFAVDPNDPTAGTRSGLSMPVGAAGVVAGLAAAYSSSIASAVGSLPGVYSILKLNGVLPQGMAAQGAAFLNGVAGAAIGFAVVSFLLDFTGVGRGLPPALTYGLMAAGAVAGGMMAIAAGGIPGIAGPLCASGVGCIILAVVIIIIVILKLFGIGKVKKIEVSYQCKPWQAAVGSDKCGLCGSDGKKCNQYACASLGQNCDIINEDSDTPECIALNKDDVVPPGIQPWQAFISSGHTYDRIGNLGFTLTGPSGCLEPLTQVFFGLQLNEPGQCKYAFAHTNSFTDMLNDFGLSSLFRKNHTMILPVPSLELLGYEGYATNLTASQTMYIRCQDKNGNANSAEYTVSFCVKRGIDVSPPVVTFKEPVTDYASYLATDYNFSIYTNEPADCKISSSSGTYASMTDSLTCINDPVEDSPGLFGWPCMGTTNLVARNTTTKYVVCKDQPWLKERTVYIFTVNDTNYTYQDNAINWTFLQRINSASGNRGITNVSIPEAVLTNISESGTFKIQRRNEMIPFSFSVRKSIEPLHITDISPDNETITIGTPSATVQVSARTTGGLDGTAKCQYLFNGNYIDFYHTLGSMHSQSLSLQPGPQSVGLRCEDQAGNIAHAVVNVQIVLDNEAPRVTRAYGSAGRFTVITDEPASCKASTTSCYDSWVNGTAFSGNDQVHTLPWERRKTYYVQCKDSFDNGPGSSCSVVVRQQ